MRFFLQHDTGPIPCTGPILAHPLMHDLGHPDPHRILAHLLTATEDFLHAHLGKAAEEAVCTVVKVGALYHVTLVELDGNPPKRLACNTAHTAAGRQCMARERPLLEKLHRRHGLVPRVVAYGENQVAAGGRRHSFSHLLTQWLDGFHEWHVDPSGTIVLWDNDHGHHPLTPVQAHDLFRNIARLCTLSLEVAPFAAITDWRHGAGDFIGKLQDDRLAVRLITVRDYGPLPVATGEIRTDLFFFLLDLCLRNRLDKVAGVGETAWLGPVLPGAVVAGFRDGTTELEDGGLLPVATTTGVLDLLAAFTPAELAEAHQPLLSWYEGRLEPAELRCLLHHLPAHCHELLAAVDRS